MVKLGVNQKVIASRMGVSGPWLSRWLNNQPGKRELTVRSVEGLQRYAEELATAALGLDDAGRLISVALRIGPEFEDDAVRLLTKWSRPTSGQAVSERPTVARTTRPPVAAKRGPRRSS
jgi:transcriptional regulator with XRE-family HTH domain